MKFINILLFVLPFLFVGLGVGIALQRVMNYSTTVPYLCLASGQAIILIRLFITGFKSKLYTQDEYDKKGENVFEFENQVK